MAAQGQSVFGAAGDTGAFACIRSDGTTIVKLKTGRVLCVLAAPSEAGQH